MSKKELEDKLVDLLSFVPHRTPESVYDGEEIEEDAPFFSEAYLYHHLGKHEGRTVLGLINAIAEETDSNRRELMRKARRKKNSRS